MKSIILIIFFLVTSYTFAQNAEAGVRVSVTLNPEAPAAGNPFNLVFLIDHPVPEEVSVIAPPFPSALSMERFLRAPRVSVTGHVQTAIEFRLISSAAGRILLGSFTVTTPIGSIDTGPLVLNIHGETEEQDSLTTLSFVWEDAPRQTAAGERVTFALRADNTHRQSAQIYSQLPPPAFFMPEVPRGVLLRQSTLSSHERENGYVLKLTLIALEAQDFYLPARILQRENVQFEIPALRIRVIERAR